MTAFLDTEATQTQFALLVGSSQQAISKHVQAGTLAMGQTYRTWFALYCEKLRDEAAGRGGDDQQSLTRARTSEASASAELKILQIQEKAGKLVPVDLIEPMLLSMVTAARIELLALPDKLANELKALHGVEIDASLIEEHIHAVLAHLAKTLPGLIAENDATGGESVEATAETFDD